MSHRVIARNDNGERVIVDLDKCTALNYSKREHGGIAIKGVYLQPRARRVIVHTYSIWEDRSQPGCCIGTRYHVADSDEVARFVEDGLALEPVSGIIPELVDA